MIAYKLITYGDGLRHIQHRIVSAFLVKEGITSSDL